MINTLTVPLAAIVCFTSACSFTRDKTIAEAAVTAFNEQYSAGEFTEIFEAADPRFQETTSPEELTNILATVQERLGSVEEINQTSWTVEAIPEGSLVKLAYDVEFAEASGTEEFDYLIADGEARLLRFNIKSEALMN
ncbi:hypothetical protein [Parathermosynechococcus lividus]